MTSTLWSPEEPGVLLSQAIKPHAMQEKGSAKMHRFANPTRFLGLISAIKPWATGLCLLTFAGALYFALFESPPDYQQSETVRIMYVHVPAAWMAMFCYSALAVASASALIWRHLVADMVARATAPIGAAFTLLALATGSLWGKPMWGTWWVWDARLTSMLILTIFYISFIALSNAFDREVDGSKPASILSILGAINLPIIKFSVDWWNTLHQPASVSKLSSPSIDISMLQPLLVMTLTFSLIGLIIAILRIKAEILIRKSYQ